MIFGNAPSTEPMVEAWKDLNWKIYRLGKRDNLEKALDLRVVEPAVKPPMEFYAPLYFPQFPYYYPQIALTPRKSSAIKIVDPTSRKEIVPEKIIKKIVITNPKTGVDILVKNVEIIKSDIPIIFSDSPKKSSPITPMVPKPFQSEITPPSSVLKGEAPPPTDEVALPASPAKEKEFPSPAKLKPASPNKDSLETPIKDSPVSPIKDRPASPIKDRPASPVRDKPASPIKDRPSSPIKDRTASPIKDRPASPFQEQQIEIDISNEQANVDADFASNKDSEAPNDLEEGEIIQRIVTETITNFDDVSYPNLTCKLPQGNVLKYSVEFLLEFRKIAIDKPADMPSTSELFGDDKAKFRNRPAQAMERQMSHRSLKSYQFQQRPSKSKRKGPPGMKRQSSNYQPQPMHEPLHRAENAWVAPSPEKLSEIEKVVKEVKGHLNRLSKQNFEKVSGKIISSNIQDEETLIAIINLIFDKALDEPKFANMYAQLCLFMWKNIESVQKWINPAENLFRRGLLNKCQTEFVKGEKWAEEDLGSKEARDERRRHIEDLSPEEKLALAQEDYQRLLRKRRSLGNVSFIGELFLQGMISENVIHKCIQQLLENIENPDEENIESLCKFMTSVGAKLLNRPKAAGFVDSYFTRLHQFAEHPLLPSRIRFLVQDVIDLKNNNWRKPDLQSNRSGSSKGGLPTRVQQSKKASQDVREDGWQSVGSRPSVENFKQSGAGAGDVGAAPSIRRGFSARAKEDPQPKETTLNKYSILNNTETPKKVAEDPAVKLKRVFAEFRQTLEVSELTDDLKSLLPGAASQIVGHCFQFHLDTNAKHFDQMMKVFIELLKDIDGADFWGAYSVFLKNFEKDLEEFPRGFKIMADVLVHLYNLQLFTVQNLYDIALVLNEYDEYSPNGPDFLAEFLLALENIYYFFVNEVFDAQRFWKQEPLTPESFQRWVKFKKMQSMLVISNLGKGYQDPELILQPLLPCSNSLEFYKTLFTVAIEEKLLEDDVMSKERYQVVEQHVNNLQALFSLVSEEEEQIKMLEYVETWAKANKKKGTLSSNLELIEVIFRILYKLDIVQEQVYAVYKTNCSQENKSLLNGWFKYLENSDS